MNCLECSECVQRILNGELAPAEFETHLAACKSCHDDYLLARTLLQGIAQLTLPAPPLGLKESVVRSVLRDRVRLRRRRWLAGASATAAALFAILIIANLSGQRLHTPGLVENQEPPKQASLQDNVQEAGQALADLTRRTAADSLESSRTFLPSVDFSSPAAPLAAVPDMPSEPRRAWNDAVEGLSAGLEPLAASAMQAASFFRREVPLLGQEPGSGL
jgi:hypothetical protein